MTKNHLGFTLVEVMLALGVSAGLWLLVFAGQPAVRARAQVLDAADRIRNQIAEVQNQALAGRNDSGGGTTVNTTFFGKRIYFNQPDPLGLTKPKTLYVDSITQTGGSGGTINGEHDITYIDLPYGIKYDPPSSTGDEVVFARNADNGELETYTFSGRFHGSDGSIGLYSPTLSSSRQRLTYHFVAPNGFSFDILIDGNSNTVTRGPIH